METQPTHANADVRDTAAHTAGQPHCVSGGSKTLPRLSCTSANARTRPRLRRTGHLVQVGAARRAGQSRRTARETTRSQFPQLASPVTRRRTSPFTHSAPARRRSSRLSWRHTGRCGRRDRLQPSRRERHGANATSRKAAVPEQCGGDNPGAVGSDDAPVAGMAGVRGNPGISFAPSSAIA